MKPAGIPHETGLLLALLRVRDGRVFSFKSGLVTERGRPFPRLLVPFVDELLQHGHAVLADEEPDAAERRILLTEAGLKFLAELEKSAKIPRRAAESTVEIGRVRRADGDLPATVRPPELRSVRAFPDVARTDRPHVEPLESSAVRRSAPLILFSINLENGGMIVEPDESLLRRHGSVQMGWLRSLPDLVSRLSPQRPDVIFLQEGMWFNHEGSELLHFVERQLLSEDVGRYRGFLTLAHRSPHHQVVLINTDRMIPTHHWHGADPDESTSRYGWVQVLLNGDDEITLWLRSVHLDPRDGNDRLAEAIKIEGAVDAKQRAIAAGAFNSITSRRTAAEGEPQPHDDEDTSALDHLLRNGWTCMAMALKNTTPTIAERDRGDRLIFDRLLTHGPIALHSMWVDTSNIPYSNHRALGGIVSIVSGSSTAT